MSNSTAGMREELSCISWLLMLLTAGRERSMDIFQHMRLAPEEVCSQ